MMKYVGIHKYVCVYTSSQIFSTLLSALLILKCPLFREMIVIGNGYCCSCYLDKSKYILLPQVLFEILLVCEYRSLGKTWLLAWRPPGNLSLMRLYHRRRWFSSLAAF